MGACDWVVVGGGTGMGRVVLETTVLSEWPGGVWVGVWFSGAGVGGLSGVSLWEGVMGGGSFGWVCVRGGGGWGGGFCWYEVGFWGCLVGLGVCGGL